MKTETVYRIRKIPGLRGIALLIALALVIAPFVFATANAAKQAYEDDSRLPVLGLHESGAPTGLTPY